MPTLTIQLPGLAPVSHVLKDETITIGRMKGNTIVIEDSSISLMHAKITGKNGEFYLKDLNSTNGTVVNGQPITEARLRDLDRIRFADISGQFLAEAAPIASAAAIQQPGAVPGVRPSSTPVYVAGLPPGASSAASATPAAKPPESLPARPAQIRTRRSRVFGTLVRATAALGVVSFLGWKVFEINGEKWGRTAHAEQTLALARDLRPASEKSATTSKEARSPASDSGTKTVDELVRALKSNDAAERRAAAGALHSLGAESKAASATLRKALKDSDAEVQMWAALALVGNQTYDKAAIPVLVRVLQNDNAVLRQVACLSLGLIPYEEGEKDTVVPALAEAAGKDSNEEVRKAAQSALSILAPDLLVKAGSN